MIEEETAKSVSKHIVEFATCSIVIKRVLTDNVSGYKSKMFPEACETLNVKHILTNRRTPQKNGKSERFIQTLLRE